MSEPTQSLYNVSGLFQQAVNVDALIKQDGTILDAGYAGTRDKALWNHPNFDSLMAELGITVYHRNGFNEKEEQNIFKLFKSTGRV